MCEVGSVAEPSPLTKANLVILVWVKKALYKPKPSPKLVLAFAPVLLTVADLKDDEPSEPKPMKLLLAFGPAVLIIICHPGGHVAAVSVPRLHEDVPDTVYPLLHVGWHVDPLAIELVQSPKAPFVGAAYASQGFAEHVAAVSVPALHEDVPDTVYPALHVGWHDEPIPRELVQPPTPPFDGGAEASHGGGDGIRYHALGGPLVDEIPSKRAYDASHADAEANI